MFALENYIETLECTRIKNGSRVVEKEVVASEGQLTLYVNGHYETQFLYSRGLEMYLITGHLYSSGRIRGKSEIERISIEEQECRVRLKKGTPDLIPEDQLRTMSYSKLLEIRDLLLDNQSYHKATRGFHGAILYELSGERWFACEDIGRHNAVDTVIGYGLIEEFELSNSVLLLSGRLLSNIVSKGLNSGIPVIASMTVATSEGIFAARYNKCTLIGSLSDDSCWLYNEGRIKVGIAMK